MIVASVPSVQARPLEAKETLRLFALDRKPLVAEGALPERRPSRQVEAERRRLGSRRVSEFTEWKLSDVKIPGQGEGRILQSGRLFLLYPFATSYLPAGPEGLDLPDLRAAQGLLQTLRA